MLFLTILTWQPTGTGVFYTSHLWGWSWLFPPHSTWSCGMTASQRTRTRPSLLFFSKKFSWGVANESEQELASSLPSLRPLMLWILGRLKLDMFPISPALWNFMSCISLYKCKSEPYLIIYGYFCFCLIFSMLNFVPWCWSYFKKHSEPCYNELKINK